MLTIPIYSSLLCMHRAVPCCLCLGDRKEVQVACATYACENQVSPGVVSLVRTVTSTLPVAAQSAPQVHSLVPSYK